MDNIPFSYGYANLVRDVSSEYQMVMQDAPSLLSIIGVTGYRARQHKHEYPEDVIAPESTTTTANVNNATGTIPVTSRAPFVENAIVRIEGTEELLRVLSVHETLNQITVARAYGDTTAAPIPSGATLVIVSKPKLEASRPNYTTPGTAPTLNYNYTEIFDGEAVAPLSQGSVHGIGNPDSPDPVGDMLNYRLIREMYQLQLRMNAALIYGRRVAKTATTPGTMGGLLQAHSGGNAVDAAGADLSMNHIAQAMAKCFAGGANRLDTLLCSDVQALKISDLYSTKLQVLRQDTTVGQAIYQVQSGLPIAGFITTVVVERQFPKSKISLFAKDRAKMVWQRPLTDKDSTPPGADFAARRMIGEVTAEWHNWQQTACLINNLKTN